MAVQPEVASTGSTVLKDSGYVVKAAYAVLV